MRKQSLILSLYACLSCATVTLPAIAGELDDGNIIAIYNQVNSFDIETGLLGAERGHSPEVRALGAMVVRDHSGVRQAADKLASDVGVVAHLPSSRNQSATDHYEAMAKLLSLSGEDFDKAYLDHEIAFHEAAIDALKGVLLPSTQRPELADHFKVVLPAFEGHLEQTKSAAKKLGYR